MPKFKVGDQVWWAKCRWESIRIPCPTCFGKLKVKLILGNDDEVILPCHGCAPGYESPRGYIEEYHYLSEPELICISGMDIEIHGDKETVRYNSSQCSYDEEDLFSEQTEALDKSKDKKRKLDEEQRTKAEYIKKKVHKDFSWNAHYHMGEAKRLRKTAEYHDKMAVVCKSKSKKELMEE
jgi:hypothetical protein